MREFLSSDRGGIVRLPPVNCRCIGAGDSGTGEGTDTGPAAGDLILSEAVDPLLGT